MKVLRNQDHDHAEGQRYHSYPGVIASFPPTCRAAVALGASILLPLFRELLQSILSVNLTLVSLAQNEEVKNLTEASINHNEEVKRSAPGPRSSWFLHS